MYEQHKILSWLTSRQYLDQKPSQNHYDDTVNRPDDRVWQLLADSVITSEQLNQACQALFNLEFVDLSHVHLEQGLFSLLPASWMIRYQMIPLRYVQQRLLVAVSAPLEQTVKDDLMLITGLNIQFCLSHEQWIEQYLYDHLSKSLESEMNEDYKVGDTYSLSCLESDHVIKQMVSHFLMSAIEQEASDIHFERYTKNLIIKFRIDGYLITKWRLNICLHSQIVNSLKVMANLDIAEKRLPQDGHIKIAYEQRHIDLRLSTLPLTAGEKLVLRILDQKQQLTQLEKLGFGAENQALLTNMMNKPYGLILLTGPTGSGKSTTLYSILNGLKGQGKNIMTIEDPVEYEMEGLNQLQVNARIGLTFAQGLRAILRQDPDIIMIGEIRDRETAQIAVSSANTGHLVMASMHTNDAVSAINRLLDMGIESYLIAQCLLGVVAQRLVRKNCPICAVPTVYTSPLDSQEITGKRGLGCQQCYNIGFKGRVAIQEMFIADQEIRQWITVGNDGRDMKQLLKAKGMASLYDDGLCKVQQGLTTLEEVLLNVLLT